MRKFSLTIAFLLLFGGISFTKIHAPQITNSNLLQNLLDLPAPPPNPIRSTKLADRIERTADFYDLKKAPPDNAPIEDLLDYWAVQNQMVRRNDLNRDGVNVNKFEEKLQHEVKENSELIEVYGFVPNAQSGQVTIRIFKDHAVFTVYDDASRYQQRELNRQELEGFRNNLGQTNFDTIPPLYGACRDGCEGGEFLTLNRTRGRRVFIRAADGIPEPLDKLQSLFEEFAKSDKMKLHYYLEDKIKGLELLLADKTNEAKAVWKRGNDLRILVADSAKYEANKNEAERATELAASTPNSDEEQTNENEQRDMAKLEFSHFSWRDLQSDGSLGGTLSQPTEAPFLRDDSDIYSNKIADERRTWQVRSGVYEIHIGSIEDADGAALIKTSRSQAPVILKKGNYASPLVTPDGK